MKKIIIILFVAALIVGGGTWPVMAASDNLATTKGVYSIPSAPAFEDWLNTQDHFTHQHMIDVPEEKKFQKEVGLDLAIYENETVELFSETRYNFETSVTTSGTVLKVKKSLWSLAKGLFNK